MVERSVIAVFLISEDVDALVAFYRDRVGLPILSYEPGHSAWFDTGAVKLAVHRPESEDSGEDFVPAECSTVVWLETDEDIPDMAAALRRRDVPVLEPRKTGAYLYVRDPEGRLLAFHRIEEDDEAS